MTGHRMPIDLPDLRGGSCRDLNSQMFFPDESHEDERAREMNALCTQCPVNAQCLEYALSRDEYGIWAATTRDQRRSLRRRAQRAAHTAA